MKTHTKTSKFKRFRIISLTILLTLLVSSFTSKAQETIALGNYSLAKQVNSRQSLVNFTYYNPGFLIPLTLKVRDVSFSPTSNIGMIHGATWVGGFSGNALTFNGVDNYIRVNNTASFDFTDAITVEARVRPNVVNNWKQSSVVTAFEESKYKWKMGLTNTGDLRFDVYGNQTEGVSAYGGLVEANKWYHIVGTFDGTNLRVYLNGFEVGVKYWPYPMQNVTPATYIGYEPVNGRYFNGTIDEVRIYNRALNASEVSYRFHEVDIRIGVVAEWKFDEGNSIIATDTSQNVSVSVVASNIGMIHGATWVGGFSGNALTFNGVDNYIRVNNTASFDFTDAITVEARVRPNVVNNWKQSSVVTAFEESKYKWKMGLTNTGDLRFDVYGNQTEGVSAYGGLVEANKWYHIVGTFDGTNLRVYLNGFEVGVKYWPYPMQNVTPATYIGYEPVNGRYFNGTIDEVRIYNRALNASEVSYSSWNMMPLNTSGLVAWWRINEGSGGCVYNYAPSIDDDFTILENVKGPPSSGWFNNTIILPDYEGTYKIIVSTPIGVFHQIIKASKLHCTIEVISNRMEKLQPIGSTITIFGTVNYCDGAKVKNGYVSVNGTPIKISGGFWSFNVTETNSGKYVYEISDGNDGEGVNMLFTYPKDTIFYSPQTEAPSSFSRIDNSVIIFEITLVFILFASIAYEIKKMKLQFDAQER